MSSPHTTKLSMLSYVIVFSIKDVFTPDSQTYHQQLQTTNENMTVITVESDSAQATSVSATASSAVMASTEAVGEDGVSTTRLMQREIQKVGDTIQSSRHGHVHTARLPPSNKIIAPFSLNYKP